MNSKLFEQIFNESKKDPPSKEDFDNLIDSFLDPQRTPGYGEKPKPKLPAKKKPSNAWRGGPWESMFD
jgi:hypothetical protein